jgi:hypothetical protein
MDTALARAFVQRGVIRQGTVLEAYQSARGLSCVCDSYALTGYVVLGASASGEWVYFNVVSSQTQHERIRCDFVKAIDGMDIARVAAAHHLHMDGRPVVPASRRGAKPEPAPVPADTEVPADQVRERDYKPFFENAL